ncbi:hypothetical protein TNCV_115351 [Trichonephila clavipes]|nr:hypothetical protein TNCV_115351 [Trichonephila clavipes]
MCKYQAFVLLVCRGCVDFSTVSRNVERELSGINTNPKILCPEDPAPGRTNELQHLQRATAASPTRAAKEKNHYRVPPCSKLQTTLKLIKEEESPTTTVRNRSLHKCRSVGCKEDQLCVVPLNGTGHCVEGTRLCLGKRGNMQAWTQLNNGASVLFTDESRFSTNGVA